MEHHLTENIKILREQRKIKQADLSALLGLRQSTWSGYEKGSYFPKFEDLLRIADFFDISLDNLIYSDLSETARPPKGKKSEKLEGSGFLALLSTKDDMIGQLKQAISSKEEIIAAKEETISLLRQLLNTKENEINKLNAEIEESKKTAVFQKIKDGIGGGR